ncbi:MAG: Clp protease N-terminal domain-containing protein, partial [Hyphomicrobium sp.]
MGYRGEDLDLRTPQTWSATPADLAVSSDAGVIKNGQRTPSRAGPIWVDDTVLACANHAYDVALAHRAGDVRLEHFLHALTRIDAAAEALEARGVRVAALRRESATIIASEIPVGLANGKGTPRRSEELADVLQLAASIAARR